MKILLLNLLIIGSVIKCAAQSSSLYQLKLPSISGGDSIDFSNFQGKKLLLVNSATLTNFVGQLASLEQLHQRFKDSNLVIIACPSNSFGHEPGSNTEVFQFLSNSYSPHFIVTGKIETMGENAHPLYKWISSKEQNGVMNGKVKDDFTKFLINAQGQIVGFYSTQVDPQSEVIVNAIRSN